MSHSPEPWKVKALDDATATIQDAAGKALFFNNEPYERYGFEVMTLANAERIVACVNACKGIPTDRLEKVARGEGLQLLGADLLYADLEAGEPGVGPDG